MRNISIHAIALVVFVTALGRRLEAQPVDWVGFSIGTIYLTILPITKTYRPTIFIADGKDEVSIYFNAGRHEGRSEKKVGGAYRYHLNGYGKSTPYFSVEGGQAEYILPPKSDDGMSSRMAYLFGGIRLGYSWHFQEKWYLRPQIGADLIAGFASSGNYEEYSTLPFGFLLPDFQLEFGYSFRLGT